MKIYIRYRSAGVALVLAVFLAINGAYAQNVPAAPSRQAAFDAFNKGKYEEAYAEFAILLQNYEKDPLYKYYTGVCLVNLLREPERAASLLREAVDSPQEIRSVPADALFYLGRSQQMSGRFAEAVKSYGRFSSKAGKKVARSFNVERYIQECNEGRGKLDENLKTGVQDVKVADAMKESLGADQENAAKAPPVKVQPRREDLPDGYDKRLTEGMDYQLKADSLRDLSAEYRKSSQKLSPSERAGYREKISGVDSLEAHFQKLANQKLDVSGTTDTGGVTPAGGGINIKAVQDNEKPKAGSGQVSGVTVVAEPSVIQRNEGVNALFEVIKDPAGIENQKIEIDAAEPQGLIYRIQMGVFSKPVAASFFRGISPVSGFTIKSTGMIRYFAGMFRRLSDANKALLTVKQMGFKDSFIVAISDGRVVSMERASVLEREWGLKPIPGSADNTQKTPAEIVPPTLSFRIEIARSAKPLKDDISESYRKLAGTRGFEILTSGDGSTVYLIGKFITFESASEYADLLNRNGYREAKVVAYLGEREIPVETAKQLFEKVK